MKLDLGSIMFNLKTSNGGTCSWGTALGQNAEYKFDLTKNKIDFFTSMIYKKVPESLVECKLGKGGHSDKYDIVLSAVFDKVYVNNELIENAEFLLFIVEEHTDSHNGRRSLKYVPAAKYNGNSINEDCIDKIKNKFNLSNDSAWIITNISFKNQDELHFEAYFFGDSILTFKDSSERKSWIISEIKKAQEKRINDKTNYLVNEFNIINSLISSEWDAVRFFGTKFFADLDDVDLDEFLKKIGIKDSAKIELQKGITLGRLLSEVDYENQINEKAEGQNYVYPFEISGDGKNLVVYGTPGCGKSYYVETELLKNHKLLADNTRERVIRTTFYQDYTNTDFIGQILPYIEKDKDGKDVVTYKFNPGPFALALKEALDCNGQEVALVIEELNRGNAPAIFGDVFQLLDRDENGISKYAITNVNLIDYLNKELGTNLTNIKIPGNLFIYATMNTSDQNVFTLDTAFKRRWDFKKIKNEFKPDHSFAEKYIPGMQLTWKDFVKSINQYMTNDQSIIGAEDKQIGVYFIDESGMRQEVLDVQTDEQKEEFAYKIFEYLWDDVAKFDRRRWFRGEIKTLDDLIDKYIEEGIKVFNEEVFGSELYNNGTVKKESESSETE